MAGFNYHQWEVSRADKAPMLEFLVEGLKNAGCTILHASEPTHAPFLITYQKPTGERQGVLAYAFFANSKETKNRPKDEHRFQVKYGSDTKAHLPVEVDPFGLITTIFVGIDVERGVVIAADPRVHDKTPMFLSVEFKKQHVDKVVQDGWHTWFRAKRSKGEITGEPVEALIGVRQNRVADLISFERSAQGKDAVSRQRLGEVMMMPKPVAGTHKLVTELSLTERALFDLIAETSRLKMAVRGWVAEVHLETYLQGVPGVADCHRINQEGSADISLTFRGGDPVLVECKNVASKTSAAGVPKIDFQRTRASKSDPCSRYYQPSDFALLAACLHGVTKEWKFQFMPTKLIQPHKKCVGRLHSSLAVGADWYGDAEAALAAL